jgi:excisionase family DNA binding protein
MTDFNEIAKRARLSAQGKAAVEERGGGPAEVDRELGRAAAVAPAVAGPVLTLTEAAARQGVHRRTVRGWIRDGRLPAHLTPGGHYRVAVADLANLPLTTDEFAAAVGVCRRTALRWCEAGKLEARKTGREWLIAAGEVAQVGARPRPRLRGRA